MLRYFSIIFLFLPLVVLASNKVEINTASLEQLDEIIGIGPALGQRIIDDRPFSSIDDLLRVSGIGEKTLQKIKDQGLAYVENSAEATEIATIKETTIIESTEEINKQTKNAPTEKKPADVKPPLTYPTGVVFNEILPSPEGPDAKNEWIEIFNQNDFEVNLFQWKIKDKEGKITAYAFPKETSISSKEYLVLFRSLTKITLNNSKDGLFLIQPNEEIIDSVVYEKAPQNQSYNRTESGWSWSNTLTLGKTNILPQKSSSENLKTQYSDELSIEKQTAEAGRKSSPLTNTSSGFNVFLSAIILAVFSGTAVLILKRKTKNCPD